MHYEAAKLATIMAMADTTVRHFIGCMTGTSLDGIDAALVRIEGRGTQMRAVHVHGASDSLGPIASRLRALAEQKPMTSGEIALLAREFSLLHAKVCERLMREVKAAGVVSGGKQPVLGCDGICVHGQTVFHEPPCSWQLFEPAPLVHAMGVPVICNLRQADLARGGQGAPITPLADVVLFVRSAQAHEQQRVAPHAIVNLGGFCNVTAFDAAADTTAVLGIDVCACNHVLDAVARLSLGKPFDAGGAAALQGKVSLVAREQLLGALFAQLAQRRSLGTGDELLALLALLAKTTKPNDLAATACDAIAACIRDALPAHVMRVLVAGGGTKNAALMAAMRTRFEMCEATDAAGVPADYREAACFAVLGALCADGVSIYGRSWPPKETLPSEVAGQWCGLGNVSLSANGC